MAFQRIYLLPTIVFFLVPIAFFTTYTIAVLNEHVEAGFPYISDTGNEPPESCIFGQLLNLAAFIICGCVLVKYWEIKHYISKIAPEYNSNKTGNGVSKDFNKVSLTLGLISCLGLDIIANFQAANVMVVHMLGAFLCFGFGTVYFLCQTWISYRLPILTSRRMLTVRGGLVAVCIATTISTLVTAAVAYWDYQSSNKNPNTWTAEDGGWDIHLTSTICEWILGITYCLIIATFVPDFYDLEFKAPIVAFKDQKYSKEISTEL